MSVLVEQFYQDRKGVPGKQRGCICIAPVGYLLENLLAVRCDHFDPGAPQAAYYSVKKLTPQAIGKRSPQDAFHRFPDAELKLAVNEEHLIVKHKLRPVLLMSPSFGTWFPSLVQAGTAKRFQQSFLCVPMYTLNREDGTPKFSAEFLKGMRLLDYPCLFPLPEGQPFNVREGFFRFDRVQMVHESHLDTTRTMLTEDALFLVWEALVSFLTCERTELVAAYAEELAKAAEKIEGNG